LTTTGWRRWLTTTNHKDVGILYLITSLTFFMIGGIFALLLRTQLARPDNDFLSSGVYNQLVTMHGAVMVLFFLSPFAFAFGNYLVPLQIGARDLAFPRINAISYWLYLAGGLVAASGFLLGGAADVGWTFYSPLTSKQFSPGLGVDLAGIGLLLLAISVTVSTINFLVTILQYRAPGMRLYDMPMFTWSILFTLIIMLFAFPALGGALLMLEADRHLATHFFDPNIAGTILWTHLFWFFGHPEVYIVLLPGLGAVMEIIPVFSKRPLYGRKYLIGALAVATFLSFIVWVHHMFMTGIDPRLRELMTITTETISIPFGVIFLCLIATLWRGRINLRGPMLFALGFIGLFLLGGLTGVFLSSVALDYNLRGSYWVVAHFHYTLVGGGVIGMLAGFYYWYPKMTGRMLDERFSKTHFWMCVVGFNLTFLTQFFYSPMPRRIYTYAAETGWGPLNLLSTVGAFIFGTAQLVLIFNALWSLRHGPPAGPDPWKAPTFEWTTPSPPPQENFHRIPTFVAKSDTPEARG
jgi:cytochrome c oxidase subunit I+III